MTLNISTINTDYLRGYTSDECIGNSLRNHRHANGTAGDQISLELGHPK